MGFEPTTAGATMLAGESLGVPDRPHSSKSGLSSG